MSRRALALALWALTVVAAVIAMAIVVATRDTAVPTSWGFRGASEAFGLACGTVGAIVAVRRPENAIGWLFLVIGLCFATQAVVNEYVVASAFVVAGGLPAATALAWTLTWSWVPPIGIALIFLPLLFPTGHLLTPRWRIVAALGVVATIGFGAAAAFIPGPIQQAVFISNPLGGHGLDRVAYANFVFGPAALALIAAIVLSMSSLVIRFRRASTETRQQIKWFALAALVAAATFTLYVTVSFVEVASATKVLEILSVLSLIGLPAAAGMAILRYRLYDIDRIISRTIAYGLVTGLLVLTYIAFILVLQGPLASLTGGETIAVALSTLVAAALFQPLRRRVQATVDRRFDRARYDADRTVVSFSERLRHEVDIDTVASDLRDTVQSSIQPERLGLWLRQTVR